MHLLKATRCSCKILLGDRVRSGICGGAFLLAVAACILAAGASQSGQVELRRQLDTIGKRIVVVRAARIRSPAQKDLSSQLATTLSLRDVARLRSTLPEAVRLSGLAATSSQARCKGRTVSMDLLGVEGEYFSMFGMKPATGRLWSSREEGSTERLGILGSAVCDELFGNVSAAVVGQWIRVADEPIQVIGVLEPQGQGLAGEDQDKRVYLPLRTALARVIEEDHLQSVFVQLQDDRSLAIVTPRIGNVLRISHGLQVNQPDDFTVHQPAVLTKMVASSTSVFQRFALSISIVAALAGILSLIVVIYMSIRERTGEIGLRRALGAELKDIRVQVMIESTLLSFSGALAGLVTGLAGYALSCALLGWPVSLPLVAGVTGLAGAIALGIICAVHAANAGAKIEPASALTGR